MKVFLETLNTAVNAENVNQLIPALRKRNIFSFTKFAYIQDIITLDEYRAVAKEIEELEMYLSSLDYSNPWGVREYNLNRQLARELVAKFS